ncbi:MAG: DUF2141 domain-containing protein [Pseudomonadota bacterium]
MSVFRQAYPSAKTAALGLLAVAFSAGCSVADPVIEPGTHQVSVTFTGVQSETGMIWASLCTEEEHANLGEAPCSSYGRVDAVEGAVMEFPNIASGVYAISAFHDDNANGALDFDTRGIPFEPTGNSGNARGFFGPPSFDQMKFVLTGPGGDAPHQINIKLAGLGG